jgi:hypothetical protein
LRATTESKGSSAFVDSNGVIEAPPIGVSNVTFTFEQRTAYVGYAMNAGTGIGPDIEFGSSANSGRCH